MPAESPTAAGPLTVRYAVVPGDHHAGGSGSAGSPGSARSSGSAGTSTARHAELTIPAAELSWRFSRSSGPGGQSVNTTDSRAELSFDLLATTAIPEGLKERAVQRLGDRLVGGVVTVAASEQRSQLQNREAARERLAELLGQALAPPPKARKKKNVPKGAVQRRLDNKARRGQTKKLRGRVDGY